MQHLARRDSWRSPQQLINRYWIWTMRGDWIINARSPLCSPDDICGDSFNSIFTRHNLHAIHRASLARNLIFASLCASRESGYISGNYIIDDLFHVTCVRTNTRLELLCFALTVCLLPYFAVAVDGDRWVIVWTALSSIKIGLEHSVDGTFPKCTRTQCKVVHTLLIGSCYSHYKTVLYKMRGQQITLMFAVKIYHCQKQMVWIYIILKSYNVTIFMPCNCNINKY